MKKVLSVLASVIFSFVLFASPVLADDASEWNEIVDAFNKETDEVYTPYGEIVEELNSSEDVSAPFAKFVTGLTEWKTILNSTTVVYSKYVGSSDPEKAEVAKLGLESVEMAKESLNLYTQAISAEDEATSNDLFQKADTKIYDAVTKHDEAVDLYNEYSGVNNSFDIRNVLIGATVVLGVISGFLFLKSRTHSTLESAIIKANVYRNLFSGTIGMTAGLGITAATYAWAIESGGSYFIFYGPVLAGFINLVKQIGWYLKVGRKQIKDVKEKENGTAVQGVYLEAPVAVK